MDAIWDNRLHSENTYLTVEQAAGQAAAHAGPRPLIIADYADNPGSGAYGDATNLLAALLAARVSNATFAPLIDPEAAASLIGAGQGATLSLPLGGKCDPAFGGGPVNGRVKVSQRAAQNVATLGLARLPRERAPASGRPRFSQSWRLPGCFGP
jgi:microcystin degradation protein MlrC